MKIKLHNCFFCGEEYQTKRTDSKFCTVACKQSAYYRRQKLQNEQVETNRIKENEKLHADKLREQAEVIDLQKKIEELQKNNLEKKKQAEKGQLDKINDMFKKFENENIKMKNDYAKKQLKDWLNQLLMFNQIDKVLLLKVKHLLQDITRNNFNDLQKDFIHLEFLNNTLMPKIKNWLNSIQSSRERYITFELSNEFKTKLIEITNGIN